MSDSTKAPSVPSFGPSESPGVVSSETFGFTFIARPLLVSGMLAKDDADARPIILVNAEQSKEEAAIAAWHEIAHLLVGDDEEKAEELGERLAKAIPEILEIAGIASAWPNTDTPMVEVYAYSHPEWSGKLFLDGPDHLQEAKGELTPGLDPKLLEYTRVTMSRQEFDALPERDG